MACSTVFKINTEADILEEWAMTVKVSANALLENKAGDVQYFICDGYFARHALLCQALSPNHVKALQEKVYRALKEAKLAKNAKIDGRRGSLEWIALDLPNSDTVINIMTERCRLHYGIDKVLSGRESMNSYIGEAELEASGVAQPLFDDTLVQKTDLTPSVSNENFNYLDSLK